MKKHLKATARELHRLSDELWDLMDEAARDRVRAERREKELERLSRTVDALQRALTRD